MSQKTLVETALFLHELEGMALTARNEIAALLAKLEERNIPLVPPIEPQSVSELGTEVHLPPRWVFWGNRQPPDWVLLAWNGQTINFSREDGFYFWFVADPDGRAICLYASHVDTGDVWIADWHREKNLAPVMNALAESVAATKKGKRK
jgi:hypothetical protein